MTATTSYRTRISIGIVAACGLAVSSAGGAVDASPTGGARLSAGSEVCFVSGALPGESVVLNVTPVDAVGAGFGTVTVSGEDWRASSNVNFVAGAANPNLVIKEPGGDGRLCYTADVGSHVLVDVLGFASFGSRPGAAGGGADRVIDTRLPAYPALTLRSDGVGPFDFGEVEATEMLPGLVAELGAPTYDQSVAYPSFDGGVYLTADGDDAFAFPFGRTVCFANGFCVEFGGASAPTVFVGYSQGDTVRGDPAVGAPLAAAGPITVGSRWADHLGAMEVQPGGCFSTGSGATTDGIELSLLSTGEMFGFVDDAGEFVSNLPDPIDVTVRGMHAGVQPFFLFGDC